VQSPEFLPGVGGEIRGLFSFAVSSFSAVALSYFGVLPATLVMFHPTAIDNSVEL
jgi:hypothetical protein